MKITYITHPDVVKDPDLPVPQWPLSDVGKRRMRGFLANRFIQDLTVLFCSTEQKAIDGAEILAQNLGLVAGVREGLGENDRSSTGYLKEDGFWPHVREFFAQPDISVKGWEPAAVAQARIVDAVRDVTSGQPSDAHIGIVAHGGVGALLYVSLLGEPISMNHGQPGQNGGSWFSFDPDTWKVLSGWETIDA